MSLGPTLQLQAGEREHVDEPAGGAGDVASEQKSVDLVVSGRAGVSEVVLAHLEQQRQQVIARQSSDCIPVLPRPST